MTEIKRFRVKQTIVNILAVLAVLFISWVFASWGEVMLKENEPLNEANLFEIICNLNEELEEKNCRQMTGTIIAKNVIVTDDGEMWTAWLDEVATGDRVLVTFNDKGTEDLTDDEVMRCDKL